MCYYIALKNYEFSLQIVVKSQVPHEGNMKSSRPSLRETRDKQSLGREPDSSWCPATLRVG